MAETTDFERDLARLFKPWGVRLLPDTFAADRRNARKVGVPTTAGGTETMDYVEEKLQSGFVFRNPNEKGRCGCGESFHV